MQDRLPQISKATLTTTSSTLIPKVHLGDPSRPDWPPIRRISIEFGNQRSRIYIAHFKESSHNKVSDCAQGHTNGKKNWKRLSESLSDTSQAPKRQKDLYLTLPPS